MTRGEVWWYEHPVDGRRPYLILTRSEACHHLNQVIAVPATRTMRGIATEVSLDQGDGMRVSCALTLDNLALVRRSLLTDRITTLGPERMAEVCDALRIATDC